VSTMRLLAHHPLDGFGNCGEGLAIQREILGRTLGYYSTDDSFGKILSDAAAELLSDAREYRVNQRVADLLDELGSKLNGQSPKR